MTPRDEFIKALDEYVRLVENTDSECAIPLRAEVLRLYDTRPPSPVVEGQPVAWGIIFGGKLMPAETLVDRAEAVANFDRNWNWDQYTEASLVPLYLAAPVPPAAAAGGGEAVAVLRDVLKWCEDHDWGHIPEPGLLYERAERVFAAAPPPPAAPVCGTCGGTGVVVDRPFTKPHRKPCPDCKPAAQSEREAWQPTSEQDFEWWWNEEGHKEVYRVTNGHERKAVYRFVWMAAMKKAHSPEPPR